ncbi:MAG: 16S rRNA (cytosine(1402)-N(4))-methyltransferase RsmH [Acetatifactor sp.]|nr:16S rRNA (cytosine(1402)-N(4))-methyltransferase RsmH [Acetatifactor sp.]
MQEKQTGDMQPEHKRRKRYSGTHPKHFAEKYKEHDPEKYGDTIAKVISKGSTPAGMHISIMVNEILDFLQIRPGQTGLDGTLGYGGHTRKMLEELKGSGHVYSLDIDPIEIVKTEKRLRDAGFGEDIFTPIRQNFANIDLVSAQYGPFDFCMADLGVSSMQIDNPERGFSYKLDGPLDLRLDPEKGIPAWQRLSQMNRDEIIGMFVENSDEPYADKIASEILKRKKKGNMVKTTTDLREAVETALAFLPNDPEKKDILKKTCQRVFQAIRIDVNSEFEVLDAFLTKLPGILKSGGRVAILTFHSGEDRLVKKAFAQYYKEGIFSEISTDVIRPSAEECKSNPRARSTKMRWAVKK